MALQLARYALCFHVEDHHCSVNSARGQEVAFAIEAHTCGMAASQAASCRIWVILCEDKGVNEREIHGGLLVDVGERWIGLLLRMGQPLFTASRG